MKIGLATATRQIGQTLKIFVLVLAEGDSVSVPLNGCTDRRAVESGAHIG